jgi:ATP-dependent RNA helicase SUPV3L1/SUV3
MLDSEYLDGAQRERLRARLQRYVDDRIRADLAPLFVAADRSDAIPAARGKMHRLTEALGVIPVDGDVQGDDDAPAEPRLRAALRALGVRSGRLALFMPALLKPRAAAMRAQLLALQRSIAVPPLPAAGLVSVLYPTDWPPGFAAALGWVAAGPMLLRLDVAEQVAGELGWATRNGAMAVPPGLASRLSIKPDLLPVALRALGFRVVPGGALGPAGYGPPTPAMLLPLRRRRLPTVARQPARPAHGPFAALAALKR